MAERRKYIKTGMTNHPLNTVYRDMKSRCYNPRHPAYRYYGAKGIKICNQWLTDKIKFFKWAMANGWITGLVLDRIKGKKDYQPENCRFITKRENGQNKEATPVDLIISTLIKNNNNRSITAKELGIDKKTIYNRLGKKTFPTC